ncbi:hypothetical protein BJF96_g5560 [Verticillium dahliae]|uniref:lytic cellulose monooxygenase (C4-dehydrogenating) n=1 Tax=Verticillium dahliae TaxID=27337 RepID=A0AA44WH08_VERDA|nr:hypothetical protein BJF96_g5560 [Verticillium dahliae]
MNFCILAAAALTPLASAHYFFDKLIIDDVETRSNEFVRSSTPAAKYNPTKWENIRDDMTPDVNDFRCKKGAFTFASQTGTAEVKAGSKLAVKLVVGATMQHPGPALVYMSKAPTTAKSYEGDGEWFKIFEESVCNTSGDFTKDACCVQVKVTGGRNGTPGPTVKFPGAYKKDDSSFNFSIYGGVKDYPMPGPAVWTGGNSGESTDPVPVESEPIPAATSDVAPAPVVTTEPASPTTAPGSGSGSGGDFDEVCTRTRRHRQRGRKARSAFRVSLRKLSSCMHRPAS